MRFARTTAGVFLAGLVLLPHVHAQSVGEIVGTVSDPSHAVISQAKVSAVEKQTGFTRNTLTSGSGTYSLVRLPVGTYTVSVAANGFKAASTDVTLDVEQTREVSFSLVLGQSNAQVEVSATAALLNTTDATLGGLIDEEQVSTLPLNGRDMVGLVFLLPGVQTDLDETGFHKVANETFSVNGNRAQSGASYIDGFDTEDYDLGGAQFTNFNLDAVAEFRVLQNNYSAVYGQGAGSIIDIVTKSGTDSFHGSGFEFIRNNVLDASNWFSGGVPELPFKRNEFGATFGGPVIKRRTFFFAQYAGFRQSQSTPDFLSVPTADERTGIVDIVGSNGQPDQLTVPLNSVAQQVLQQYPQPNDPTGAYGARTFSFEGPNPKTANQWSGRLDHRISNKDTLFGRYINIHNGLPILEPDLWVFNPSFSSFRVYNEEQIGISWTHVFGPHLISNARFSWEKSRQDFDVLTHATTYTSFSDGSISPYGPDTGGFGENPEPWNYHENISWNKGRHTIEIGEDFLRLGENNFGGNFTPQGQFSFQAGTPLPTAITSASGQNNIAAGSPSPTSLISFLEGAPQTYLRQAAFPGFGPTTGQTTVYSIKSFSTASYIQDDFRVTQKLTLNLGFRYEYNSVPYETEGRTLGVLDSTRFESSGLYRKVVLNPSPFYYPDHRGVGPRLGIAYKVTDKTVVRGGYAVLTNRPMDQLADDEATGYLSSAFGTATLPVYSLTPLSVSAPVVTDLNGNPLPPGGNPSKVPPNTLFNLGPVTQYLGGPLEITGVSQSLRNGYVLESNVTLERELPGDMLAQVGWIGNNGVKLIGYEWPNAYTGADPQYTPFTTANGGNVGEMYLHNNSGHSTYNALQAVLRKNSPLHGIQFQGSFNWSKLLSNADATYNGPAGNSGSLPQNPTCISCDRGISSYDFPFHFTANVLYAIPNRWGVLPERLTSGWQISSIVTAESGFPFTVFSPRAVQGFGFSAIEGISTARPDLVQPPPLNSGGRPPNQFFSNAVIADGLSGAGVYFSVPGCPDLNCTYQSRSGTMRRNSFRTGSISNDDFSLVKDTKVRERLTVQFRAEFFNLLNQHAFNIPGQTLGASGFGVATSTVNPERQIQFGLRLIF